jgi:ribosomal protein L11 methyltransferase
MTASYVEIEIKTSEELVDQLVALFSQVGFEGFWEEGPLLRCYINQERWTPGMTEEIHSMVNRMARSNSTTLPAISVRSIVDRNWNEEWEKTIKPIHVTDRIVITPTWHQYDPRPNEIVLIIDPKMSFGTGYHETTRVALRLMEKYITPGTHLLDVGTGTGVLAIAGIRLGAISAIGVDIDEWSYSNALENLEHNAVQHRIKMFRGDISSAPAGLFGMIVANIQLNVIKPLLTEMKNRLSPGGVLIVSGLLVQDRDEILSALGSSNYRIIEELRENEWIGIAARI